MEYALEERVTVCRNPLLVLILVLMEYALEDAKSKLSRCPSRS